MGPVTRTLATRVARIRNVLIVLLAVAAGVLFPGGAAYVRPVTVFIVTLLVYSSIRGVSVTRQRLSRAVEPVATASVLTFILVPAVGITWAKLSLSDGSLLGVAVVLSAPATAGSAIVWTRLCDGNEELSGMTAIASIALAPLLMPIVLFGLVGNLHSLDVVGLATKLFLVIVLAVGLRRLVPEDVVGESTVEYGSLVAISLLIYAGVGGAGLADTSLGFLGRIGSLVLVVFLVGLLAASALRAVSARRRPDLLAVLFAGTLKNLGISLFVVLSLGSDAAIHAVIVYYVGQQLLSALVVDGVADGVLAIALGDP